MYKIGDFNKENRISVLCRGKSLVHLSKIHEEIDACFIVGQFKQAFKRLNRYMYGKKIVPIINKSCIEVPKNLSEKMGIKDVQCNFAVTKPSLEKLHRRAIRKNPWAKVHVAPIEINDRKIRTTRKQSKPTWATTGMMAIDLATLFKPKEIWILGLDFYTCKYFSKEKLNTSIDRNRGRKKIMLKYFYGILKRDPDIHFTLFTKAKKIKKHDNLTVNFVPQLKQYKEFLN